MTVISSPAESGRKQHGGGAGAEARPSLWHRVKEKIPGILATTLTLIAVLCALRALSLPLRQSTEGIAEFIEVALVPVPPNLAYAVFLGLLAGALASRKRVAFRIALIYLALIVVLDYLVLVSLIFAPMTDDEVNWIYWFILPNTVIMTLLLGLLIAARDAFRAKVQPGSFYKALGVLGGGLAAGILLGWGLVEMFPGSLTTTENRFLWAVEKVLGGAFQFTVARDGSGPGWVNLTLGLFGAIALLLAVLVLFRSQRANAELTLPDEARIRALLDEHGERDSLGYFATRHDKTVRFSPSGKAAVTYRVVAGVSLASGDPIGDPEAWGGAIRTWLDEAEEHAWTPAVMGAGEEGAKAYARAGLSVLQLGDEAILNVGDFTLEGRNMRVVRQAAHRVERAGYTLRVRRHSDIPADEMEQIIDRVDAWRDTETERGFSMALGRLGDPDDGRCVLVETLGPDGRLAAVLSFVPWGCTGLSLDVMRRDRAADNGLMEFMVSGLMKQAPRLGVQRVSLNFAVFRAAFEEGARIGAGPVLRAWRGLLLFFSRWWQLEALYRSNVKYRPVWNPRFLCFAEARDLAKVGLASAIAEGFLTAPRLPSLLRKSGHRPSIAAARSVPAGQRIADRGAAVAAGDEVATEFDDRDPVAAERAHLPEQVRVRLDKIDAIRGEGRDPYPVGFGRTHTCADARALAEGLAPDSDSGTEVSVTGRVTLVRDHGGVCFATVSDWSGEVQLMLTEPTAGKEGMARWRHDVDLGDHVGVRGTVATSRRGEPSVAVTEWRLTAKCLRPLPDKRRGLADPEARVRQRYLDLTVNDDARRTLRARTAAILSLRESLVGRGFMEVETPILQPVHGGANARPFTTHINAYDMDLYLRIAPELFLKRLCVGGVEKVFELGRTFRNEGVSFKHNPEFTMLEAYQAYADYNDMRLLTQDMIQKAAIAANGAPVLRRRNADGSMSEIDIGGDWPAIPINAAISEATGTEVTADTPVEELVELAARHGIPLQDGWNRGEIVLEIYEHLVEEKTERPTFYMDFPTEVSPLTRQHRDDPRLAEKWDLVAFGTELGTAYSELIDPVEQRKRLTAQSLAAAAGDPEAMELDEDFLRALEYAMPPTGGLGIGVDRLIMMITGLTIRETLPFPLVRPGAR
ncbi:lysyl-tRNA synthetase class 2 [Nocardiopsis mwathae]|uniref:Lysine--tRNA ligase n=1 Tax=Nocardiopsis mwathae TaxID=1472723 RepID=A0A7W9YK06_9ACTN|nr:bifunctional lysylphosphatidylglycerol synthetase/lysine--tRNA ligase LysX [Nocardiopsis mwathae]MBB6173578.1 lysyl-tRNA synthetase class 2 [Nocardiopsis mwathae]